MPSKNRAPILIAADSQCEMLKCYVDSEPMHCAKPTEALLLLIASYYIFNINYEKQNHLQFILLENIIFGQNVKRIAPGNSKYLSLLHIMDKANISFFANNTSEFQ